MENNSNMTEQEYLELSNQLKETYDKISKELINKNIELNELKKVLCSAYGIVRILDNILDGVLEIPHQINTLVECLRTELSECMDTYILNENDSDNNETDSDGTFV